MSCSILWSAVQSSVWKCWDGESAQECEQTCFFLGNITHSWVPHSRHIWNSSAARRSFSSRYDRKNWKLMFLQETPPSSSHFMRYSKFVLTENVNYHCIFSHHWYLIIEVFGRDKTQPPTFWVTLVFPLLRNRDFATSLSYDSTPNSERSNGVCFGQTPPNHQGRSEERAPKTYVELHARTGTRGQIFHRKRAALQTET